MKILKYLIAFITVLAIIFFAKGFMTPSISYESEIIVNKPANEAWAVMGDKSKRSQWIEGFKKTELISGTENTVGAVSKIYVEEQGGQEMVMEETIKDIKPNELLAIEFTMDFMDMDYEMNLSETDGKTTIKSKSITKGNGILAKSMISFMTGAMKAQEDANMNSLKKLIEENTTNYFPQPEPEIINFVYYSSVGCSGKRGPCISAKDCCEKGQSYKKDGDADCLGCK